MNRERFIVTELIVVLGLLWLIFSFHRAPTFPGSPIGGLLGVSAAFLMVVLPILYGVIKSVGPLRRLVSRAVTMRTLLALHIYTGAAGAILGLLHTGHKFENTLGIALVATMLAAVLSGYVARYFLSFIAEELREKQALLTRLQASYREAGAQLGTSSALATTSSATVSLPTGIGRRARAIAESIADVEYSIKTHELFRRRASRWLKVHAIVSGVFYLLVGLHVWAVTYFGIRWLR